VDVRVGSRRYLAGDHTAAASIEGAIRSGLRAARAVLADLRPAAATAA
jgi:monoamine oxidase